jgi:hypothetical protein
MNADYPPEWHTGAIQARIRALAHYTCEICGRQFDPDTNQALAARDSSGKPLVGHVHHLDHHPPNCTDDNLIFLCQPCHIRLHGQGWKPGAEMPLAWGNEPPPWVLRRQLPYRPNPMVASLQESARYATSKIDRAQFLIGLIESQGWIQGVLDPPAEMRALLQTTLAEYAHLLDQRAQAAAVPLLHQAAQWATENGLIDEQAAQAQAGLDVYEWQTALEQGLIAPSSCPITEPFIPAYYDLTRLQLDTDTIQHLRATTLLTRAQAAAVLGVPVAVFERRRRDAGIRHMRSVHQASGQHERLYRKIDVLKLRK